jgi:hydrophobic/amphiphilic exporter-1 (mainly G- bacteria), HAE1 family
MNLSELFIRRPIMTALLMIALAAFGITAYRALPISDLPTVDYPTITVSASLPGAAPSTMAASVATPLEKEFSTIAGVDNMVSTSTLGSTAITIQFSLDRDIDEAAQDVNSAIAQTLHQLPPDMQPPSYQKVNPAASPILYFALTSPTVSLQALDEVGETTIGQRLSMVSGVAQVEVFGSMKYAVRIQLDPMALAYRKISIDAVETAIAAQNANVPTGVLNGGARTSAYTMLATGQLQNASDFRSLAVTEINGTAVKLGMLGNVLDDVQNNQTASWFNGTRAIVLAIQRQPGSNTVGVAHAVQLAVDSLQDVIPGGVSVQTLFDRSIGIEDAVNSVKFTLVLTLVLVVLVIFLFLRNLSATIIPSLALPMSVLGTFAVMYLLGYSLDNLSLMALTLSVGFVVDDAVVMLENIVRHLEMDKPALQAALDGAREVGFTILSMTLSLTAVFIPLLFMSGIIGRLFREFAVTIAVAILISGVVALTLIPMLSSRFLRSQTKAKHGRIYMATEHAFDWLLRQYDSSLGWCMRHRKTVVAFSLCVLAGTYLLFRVIPTGFMPDEDTGQISVTTQAAQGASFTQMVAHQQELAAIVGRDSNIAAAMSSVGSGNGSSSNQGRFLLGLKPLGKRLSAADIITELRPKLAAVPGIVAYLQMPPAIQIGARSSASAYQFTLQAGSTDTLYPAATKLLTALQGSSMLVDVTSDLQLDNPQVTVEVNRTRASALGVSAAEIENTLYDAYGSRQVSTIYAPQDEFWVVTELLPKYQQDPSALGYLYVQAASGQLLPLSSVSTITKNAGPVAVAHSGQLPSVTLSFNLQPGVALGTATAEVQRIATQTLPASITTSFQGTAQAFESTEAGLVALVILAVFVIYVVLGVLYESFIHPITILSGLPFAAFGALLALYIFRVELSIYAFVGIILLIGIVKKNAIMMIDFALEAERTEGMKPADAIVHAAHIRFRPIMMTTVAALAGAVPVAVASGFGSEARRPLGIAVVGGLAFSQLITLFVTPVFYTYMDALSQWIDARTKRGDEKATGQAKSEGQPAVTSV